MYDKHTSKDPNWRFPRMGVPPNHPSQSLDHFNYFSLETYGDLGISHLKKHLYPHISC